MLAMNLIHSQKNDFNDNSNVDFFKISNKIHDLKKKLDKNHVFVLSCIDI